LLSLLVADFFDLLGDIAQRDEQKSLGDSAVKCTFGRKYPPAPFIFVGNTLMDMYINMGIRDHISWTTILACFKEGIMYFRNMLRNGLLDLILENRLIDIYGEVEKKDISVFWNFPIEGPVVSSLVDIVFERAK
ncbi:hypothetical protein ACJX0J_040782, partial [Zea mays]